MRLLALLSLALPVLAGVAPARRATSDVQTLHSALQHELLAGSVFDQGLRDFTQADFVRTGLPPFTRGRLEQIRHHIIIHTAFLKQAIVDSDSPIVQPCTYVLSLDDPRSFVRIAAEIEAIVASAYNGAIGIVEDKDYRVALASIYGTLCRHAGWMHSAVLKENPWNLAFDVALTPRQAWTALQKYVSSCPTENASSFSAVSLTSFPPLEVIGIFNPGRPGRIKFDQMESFENQLYVVFKTGIGELRTALGPDGSFIVPQDIANCGTVYVFVTSNKAPLTDENIVAGPHFLDLAFNSTDTSS